MRFSHDGIKGAKYEGRPTKTGLSRDVRWDSGSRDSVGGLGVRVYPPTKDGESRKTFVLSYRCFDVPADSQGSFQVGGTDENAVIKRRVDTGQPHGLRLGAAREGSK